MGFVFILFISFVAGLMFLAGWQSIDSICECIPLRQNVANGTLGLFCVAGVVLGGLATALWS
jgi:hypothetical protein